MKRILESLRFDTGQPILLSDSEQYFCDRHQITLLLQRNEKNLAANRERIRRIKAAFWRVQETLDAAGIEFVVLKGFANWERYWADPELRLQYDLDLYCPDNAVEAAKLLKRLAMNRFRATAGSPSTTSPRSSKKPAGSGAAISSIRKLPFPLSCIFAFGTNRLKGLRSPASRTSGRGELRRRSMGDRIWRSIRLIRLGMPVFTRCAICCGAMCASPTSTKSLFSRCKRRQSGVLAPLAAYSRRRDLFSVGEDVVRMPDERGRTK